ncbi:ATP-binding protein [Mameliella alba]|uniref:ATP-binding protein n=1 Tax=Mameliella alba TaxID=561184 RepID=UPI003012AC06
MEQIRTNARTLRALIAITIALGLAALLLDYNRAHGVSRELTVRNLNTMLWSISELNFESQRLIGILKDYEHGTVDLETAQLRFDVLWSRVDIVRAKPFGESTGFHELVADFDRFLHEGDGILFASEPPTQAQLSHLVDRLNNLTIHSRRLWSGNFGTQNPASRVLDEFEDPAATRLTDFGAITLLVLLMLYVLAEIFFAGRGQRKEAELRREAAEANAAKTRFLANVSHEIRTPLNGILGMASELSESQLTEDQAQCLQIIEQSGTVLLGTINDVLDLSRIEAGQLSVEARPFALRGLVEAACALYGARAREKDLYLTLDIQDNLPPILMGDEFRIRQVLHNLIANAVKFTSDGGVMVRVRPDLDGSRLVIAVQDSGPGIEREAQARIFEPFLQADASVTRRHGGSGLGLTISRQLCQAMGGDLMVVSRPGHGATFFCDLPLRTASAEEALQVRVETARPPDLSGRCILVADDNATNRLILDRFLRNTGAEVQFAETGEEALALVRAGGIDMVLMDVQMPVMDGVAATREIRRLEKDGGAPRTGIIAVTANVLSHQVQGYRAAGMDDVLCKPVSKRDLMVVLADRMAAAPVATGVGTEEPFLRASSS